MARDNWADLFETYRDRPNQRDDRHLEKKIHPTLRDWAERRLPRAIRNQAEDIANEALKRIIAALKKPLGTKGCFDRSEGRGKVWAFTIVQNLCSSLRKRYGKELKHRVNVPSEILSIQPHPHQLQPAQLATQRSSNALFVAAKGTLPSIDQEVIDCLIDGDSESVAAKKCGLTRSRVRGIKKRARIFFSKQVSNFTQEIISRGLEGHIQGIADFMLEHIDKEFRTENLRVHQRKVLVTFARGMIDAASSWPTQSALITLTAGHTLNDFVLHEQPCEPGAEDCSARFLSLVLLCDEVMYLLPNDKSKEMGRNALPRTLQFFEKYGLLSRFEGMHTLDMEITEEKWTKRIRRLVSSPPEDPTIRGFLSLHGNEALLQQHNEQFHGRRIPEPAEELYARYPEMISRFQTAAHLPTAEDAKYVINVIDRGPSSRFIAAAQEKTPLLDHRIRISAAQEHPALGMFLDSPDAPGHVLTRLLSDRMLRRGDPETLTCLVKGLKRRIAEAREIADAAI